MHPEEKALLSEIRLHPKDDAIRLIYADWLINNDQVARGEFIRESIRIAPAKIHTYWCVLLATYANSSSYPLLVREITDGQFRHGGFAFDRGLLAIVNCTAEQWLRFGPDAVESENIREVRLRTVLHWDADRDRNVFLTCTTFDGTTMYFPVPGANDLDMIAITGSSVHSSVYVAWLLRKLWPRITILFPHAAT